MKFTFPPGSKPLDGYTIKRGIDRGGFGEVYYAISDAGKEVALKLLQDNLDVELRGVTQCLNLAHPNLVTIFDIRKDADDDHWIIMEYLPGQTLEAVLDANPDGLSSAETQQWVSGIASGLAFLHECGIVHRDLKPANIFRRDGVVKIGDVGLSKFITHSRRGAQTESVGTLYYMAPEVAKGNYGREVDIYALGVIAYELITGNVPFDGESKAEILMKHLTAPPDVTVLPLVVQPVVARALEKDPRSRPSDVVEFATDLQQALGGFDVPQNIPESSFVNSKPTFGEPRLSEAFRPTEPESNAAAGIGPTIVPMQPVHEERTRIPVQVADDKRRSRKQTGRRDDLRQPQQRVQWTAEPSESGDGREHVSWWKYFAIGLLILVFISPRAVSAVTRYSFAEIVLIVLAILAIRALVNVFAKRKSQRDLPSSGYEARRHRKDDELGVTAPYPPDSTSRRRATKEISRALLGLTPDDPRSISFGRRLTELTGALFLAVPFTAAITAGVATLTTFLPNNSQIGFFGLTTLLGSWAVLFSMKWCEGLGDSSLRRIVLLIAGLSVGFGAFWLDQTLMVDHQFAVGHEPHGAMRFIGQHPLTEADNPFQPTIAGYMAFFVGLFALRRWWWHTDLLRKGRFQLHSALFTLALGYVLTAIFLFPHDWGMLWALAISCVVQLSAAWMPAETYLRTLTPGIAR
ncbi:MAG: serine/threonine-protein kinase [Planctomycetota bacterium]|nr:serine/threonine-protein kinase [Planctomycetota bacterium]